MSELQDFLRPGQEGLACVTAESVLSAALQKAEFPPLMSSCEEYVGAVLCGMGEVYRPLWVLDSNLQSYFMLSSHKGLHWKIFSRTWKFLWIETLLSLWPRCICGRLARVCAHDSSLLCLQKQQHHREDWFPKHSWGFSCLSFSYKIESVGLSSCVLLKQLDILDSLVLYSFSFSGHFRIGLVHSISYAKVRLH